MAPQNSNTKTSLDLKNKDIVLGLTASIACYKAAELARSLIKAGATVQVAMSESATRFMTPLTMQALTGQAVFISEWETQSGNGMAHISLSREADAIVVAPASANFIAKLAHGMADDLLSTLCLARNCPLFVAPAMNCEMWANKATQRNIDQLKKDGIHIIEPARGEQACGEFGDGRMQEPDEILDILIASFQKKTLVNKRVVITAGPTFEAIDPIRGITNRSSGKMGFALARAAAEAGAEVILISGPVSLTTPFNVQRIDIETAIEMHQISLDKATQADIFIAVAAVSDWRPKQKQNQKIKKDSNSTFDIEWLENPDILKDVAQLPNAPYCVGFAAETESLSLYAQEKRFRKGIPLIIGNIAQQAFNEDENEIILFYEGGEKVFPRADKLILARQLIGEISILFFQS